ncbi:hypothetical protein [Arthrobacter sp. lap29]|uniref:hypothetical protein n=1 Tax=Arthrobacter sp. lap29 TaxID=3056122 RepID=UPI0028F7483D|nr:hypothetical protein [Arthrobacter sp. lap29]
METLSTVILALLTIASPLAISRAKNEAWTKTAKVAVPILVAATLAIAYLYITGSITQGGDVITTILMVYGAQQLAYTTIMRWWATILEQRGQLTDDDGGPDHRA